MFWKKPKRSYELDRGFKALSGFEKWCKKHHPGFSLPTIDVVEWREHSGYPQLPKMKKAVYSFHLRDKAKVLKVGQAGGASPARYSYQHYRVDPQSSTLANSLVASSQASGEALNAENVGQWIRDNTVRVDFLIPSDASFELMNYLERFLFVEWSPVFEGKSSPRP
ncbi:hypothetical protein F9K96_07005 [Brucella anthropi]|uniref:hypothetical protein n=1 Tax=Brucella anthropi TaxID=529 RepID=UPI00124F4814|nr:hypothetical protein [Brucella anthropi]KAB2792869.1 hypothetical protein F9K96_07005 [Brucella anthropi]